MGDHLNGGFGHHRTVFDVHQQLALRPLFIKGHLIDGNGWDALLLKRLFGVQFIVTAWMIGH